MLQVCLSVGESSRLRRKLVQDTEAAVSVSISWGWRIDPGVFLAFVELAPGARREKAEALLWSEIAKVADRGVSAAEVRRAKALLRSSVLHELATHHGVAHALGQAEALLGDWREAGRALEHYASRAAGSWRVPPFGGVSGAQLTAGGRAEQGGSHTGCGLRSSVPFARLQNGLHCARAQHTHTPPGATPPLESCQK